MRFRKRTFEIEAVTASSVMNDAGMNWVALPEWVKSAYNDNRAGYGFTITDVGILIKRPGLNFFAVPGDWIIRGPDGEIASCSNDVFDLAYEPLGEAAE